MKHTVIRRSLNKLPAQEDFLCKQFFNKCQSEDDIISNFTGIPGIIDTIKKLTPELKACLKNLRWAEQYNYIHDRWWDIGKRKRNRFVPDLRRGWETYGYRGYAYHDGTKEVVVTDEERVMGELVRIWACWGAEFRIQWVLDLPEGYYKK